MNNEMNAPKKEKIILPKDIQIRMMKFFFKTSIPRKKLLELEKLRLSNKNDGSGT
jgi:hypothetical protein